MAFGFAGGAAGAHINEAAALALTEGKRYFATARVGADGHAFAFDELPKGKELNDMGCTEPCADDERYSCGCADESCGDLRPAKGEEHVRRWVVYKVDKEKGGKGKGSKKKKAAKEEL